MQNLMRDGIDVDSGASLQLPDPQQYSALDIWAYESAEELKVWPGRRDPVALLWAYMGLGDCVATGMDRQCRRFYQEATRPGRT